ncbi:MAG: hypothetical protein IAE94_01815 [Chthoniobacterales bacterium]|nr:hypothetical protein [Chthoniobacterales bacterium]
MQQSNNQNPADTSASKAEKTKLNLNPGSLALACADLGIAPRDAIRLRRATKAADIRPVWDYRARGLKLDGAIDAIVEATKAYYPRSRPSRAAKIAANAKAYYHPGGCSQAVLTYRERIIDRDNERRKNRDTLVGARLCQSVEEINEELRGWPENGKAQIALNEGKMLLVIRKDSAWWDNSRRSSRWPSSRSTSYEAKLITVEGDTLDTMEFAARKGDWLAEVGKALGLTTGKRTALTQSGAMLPVGEPVIRRCIRLTTLRLFGEGFPLYVAEAFGTNYHAGTVCKAVSGLIEKARAVLKNGGGYLDDRARLTLKDAEALGFCSEGTAAFLSEIGMDGRDAAKVADIRTAMEGHDVTPWKSELEKIGLIKAA